MRDCCKTHLEEQPSDQNGLIIRVCSVCHARHFELTADPGVFAVVAKPLTN